MTDGPFRGDHEAALARAEALEDQLAEAKAENERLRAKVDELSRPPPEPPEPPVPPVPLPEPPMPLPEPPMPTMPPPAPLQAFVSEPVSAPTTGRPSDGFRKRVWGVWALAIISVLAWFVIIRPGTNTRTRADWQAERTARAARFARWKALLVLPACLRRAELDLPAGEPEARPVDPRDPERRKDLASVRHAVPTCDAELALLAFDASPGSDAKMALAAWWARAGELVRAVDDLSAYYTKRDYEDDAYRSAGARWTQVQERSAAYGRALRAVRSAALPAIHAAIRQEQREHEARAGRDVTWWQIELGFAFDAIIEAAHASHRAGGGDAEVWTAVHEPARALLEAAKAAPLETRRSIRTIPELERMTGTEIEGLWSQIAWPRTSPWGATVQREDAAPLPPLDPTPIGSVGC